MIKKRSNTFLLMLLLTNTILFGQSPSSIINPDSLNIYLLDSLIRIKIDSVRIKHNKKALITNDTLKAAATDQVIFVQKKKALTHVQTGNKKKYDVTDRTAYYGWTKSYIGENLVYTSLTIKVKTGKAYTYSINSYNATALYMVTLWVKSKGHFENIMTDEYTRTGVAVAYDEKKKILYACQVFSE